MTHVGKSGQEQFRETHAISARAGSFDNGKSTKMFRCYPRQVGAQLNFTHRGIESKTAFENARTCNADMSDSSGSRHMNPTNRGNRWWAS